MKACVTKYIQNTQIVREINYWKAEKTFGLVMKLLQTYSIKDHWRLQSNLAHNRLKILPKSSKTFHANNSLQPADWYHDCVIFTTFLEVLSVVIERRLHTKYNVDVALGESVHEVFLCVVFHLTAAVHTAKIMKPEILMTVIIVIKTMRWPQWGEKLWVCNRSSDL